MDAAHEFTEEQLAELESFIRRMGGWLHTYPGREEGNLLHRGCLELHRRGKLRELRNEEGHAVWESIPQ